MYKTEPFCTVEQAESVESIMENGKQKGRKAARAVIYCRVSTLEQAREGISLDVQEERLRAYCMAQELDVYAVIRDEGISGMTPLNKRVGGRRLFELTVMHGVTNVVALKLDRLFRNAIDALSTTQTWNKQGTSLHLVDMGGQGLNTASAMGRMLLTVLAGFAEFERNQISERTLLALLHKRINRQVYGPVPYGWDREGDKLVSNEFEQNQIAQIQNYYNKGRSLRWIARHLDKKGISTKRGGRWYASTVKYVLDTLNSRRS